MSDKNKCGEPGVLRYTWVSGQQGIVCEQCAAKVKGLGSFMGCHVQFDPIDLTQGLTCGQEKSQPHAAGAEG